LPAGPERPFAVRPRSKISRSLHGGSVMSKSQKSFRFTVLAIAVIVASTLVIPASGGYGVGISLLVPYDAAVEAESFVPPVMTLGVCDTAGPIEVEGSILGTTPTAYATLGAAFTAINSGTHTGALTIEVCGSTNEAAIVATLNASGAGSASYTSISMKPVGGVSRTITGAPAGGSPLIDLNGSDNVTIDGVNAAGNALTIANTTISSVAGTSTIRFIGGATNNTVKNSNIQGSVTMAVSVDGGVILFSTDLVTANGNDNNTISNNNIGPAGSNLPMSTTMARSHPMTGLSLATPIRNSLRG